MACADAGCTYDPEWLARLTAPILNGSAEYALGGSCVDPEQQTIWDLASAPFFGLKQRAEDTTKSCTARSMAFRKDLWQQVGGFPETTFLGEDTAFDLRVRKLVKPAYAERAQAIYRPHHTLKTSLSMMARYGVADGVLGTRRSRLVRNFLRCVAEVAAIALLPKTVIPFVLVLLLEMYFAFRLDWIDVRQARDDQTIGRAIPVFAGGAVDCYLEPGSGRVHEDQSAEPAECVKAAVGQLR